MESKKRIGLAVLIVLLIVAVIWMVRVTAKEESESLRDVKYSEFLSMVDGGKVVEVCMEGNMVHFKTTNYDLLDTYNPGDPQLISMLRTKKVVFSGNPSRNSSSGGLMGWMPMLLIAGAFIFFMRRRQGGAGKATSFGKSQAKLNASVEQVAFSDVAGVTEAKEEVGEIVEFLKDPQKFTRLGARIPKGTLLVGSPGTGKTLLARAIAGEAGVPFFSISGSDFVEMFVGVGASRVRKMFEDAKKHAPCVIFIDEIDAVGRHRGAGLGGGHDEREQTLNQLLVEMDGFAANEGVIIIAATNRPDILDKALLRPGRFDRQVVVPVPDLRGREAILKVHFSGKKIAEDVDASILARGIPGFTGADIENLVNEAVLLATRRGKDAAEKNDFEHAKDKVMMGAERKSMIINPDEKRSTAYHEAGHVLVAKMLPGTDPVHKVTIIPRGRALGLTMQLPMDEKHNYGENDLLNSIRILMGGRVAEEVVLNEKTAGAGNDIERATKIARRMVCEFGMSEELGPLAFGKKEEQVFLGREIAQHRDFSEETARKIDAEVKRLVTDAYGKASELLKSNMDNLHKIAETLLEKETLNADEINEIVGVA